MPFTDFISQTPDEIAKIFSTSTTTGLTEKQADDKIKMYGFNEIRAKAISWYTILFAQFKSPFIIILLGSSTISFIIGNHIDAITILSIVIINSILSFSQEFKAQKTLELLKKYLVPKAMVLREEQEILIDQKLIVPGDLLIIQPGDYILADIRFIETQNVSVDESILTGESLPTHKISDPSTKKIESFLSAHNIGFSGTTMVSGKAKGIVFATGEKTEFGKIGKLTIETNHETSFYLSIKQLSYVILRMIFATVILLIMAHLIIHPTTGGINIMDSIMFAIALAVGITPEALPVISTFSLSRGALMLAHNKVLVKRLSAIEDLGSIEILCTDKTGTLTENKLAIVDIYSNDREKILLAMALSSNKKLVANKQPLHPFDIAVWQKLEKKDFDIISGHERVTEVPFEPSLRRSLILLKQNQNYKLVVRGAYEEIIKRSNISNDEKETIKSWVRQQAAYGHRVIALAQKELNKPSQELLKEESDLTFLGLIALEDPIKKTALNAISRARNLNIEIKILTGDSPEVAGAVAQKVGLISDPTHVVTSEQFASLTQDEKEKIAKEMAVFAQITPEQKFEIIQLLKKNKAVVGFLGDGINDAPSLKISDVGIVVQGAADISKDAADIILLKKSMGTIIDGIYLGRTVFVNTLNYLKITLASNFGNFYSMAAVSLFIKFLPMLPLQILLVNLLSDAPMIAIATDNVDIKELTHPTHYNLKQLTIFAIIFGIISSLFDALFFFIFYHELKPSLLQTNWFILSILTEIIFIFVGRTRGFFLNGTRPSFILIGLSIITIALTIFIPYSNLGQTIFHFSQPTFKNIRSLFIIVIGYLITCELFKKMYRIITNRESNTKRLAI